MAPDAGTTVRIANSYEDGHESSCDVDLASPGPDEDLEDWWEETVQPETGDGHGIGNKLGYCYTATVIASNDPRLTGQEREWCGR